MLLAWPRLALAHKLNVFAAVEGSKIRGNAYFRGGTPAQKVQVTALDPAGRELGRTTTDSQGNFTLDAHVRCDHRLLVDVGDGHGGECTVRAAELPASLPAGQTTAAAAPARAAPGEAKPVASHAPAADGSPQPLADEVRALNRQIVELREQLARHDEQAGFRDVLGGVGYILGLAGIAFFILGKRDRKS